MAQKVPYAVVQMCVQRMLTTPSTDPTDQWLRDQIARATKEMKGRLQ